MSKESERRTLSQGAYEKIPGDQYEPYVSASVNMPEITIQSVFLGIILAVVFGAANAYLGLKLGQTVGASVPCAVTSMAILRGVLKRGTILENNMVQTIGSAGESVAAGVVFTVPALMVWGMDVNMFKIAVMAFLGGTLGVLILIPLRRYFVSDQHGELPFPDGTACAEVLVAGEAGGSSAKVLFVGGGLAGLYTLCSGGFKLWEEKVGIGVKGLKNGWIGIQAVPALLGVGYVMGPRIAATMLSGAALGWLVIIPIISYFGASLTVPIAPATDLISNMTAAKIWSNYIKYIGTGAVIFGGVWSFIKILPVMVNSFKIGFNQLTKSAHESDEKVLRTDEDINMGIVFILILAIFSFIAFCPPLKLGIVRALLVLIFSFLFVPVAAKMTGLTSNNPISGMTIATLLVTSLVLKALGAKGEAGMAATLMVGIIVCIAVGITGDTSQDLKTGFLVGATPRKQQIGEIIGVLASAVFIGLTVKVLHAAYTIGSEALPAPQAVLMSSLIKGIFTGNLPWILIFIGMAIGAVVELLGIPVLPFAIGLYLPISLSTAPIIGGLIRGYLESKKEGHELALRRESGILFGSGLVAGDSLMGVILAIYSYFDVQYKWHDPLAFGKDIEILHSGWFTLIPYAVLIAMLYYYSNVRKPDDLNEAKEL
ncbi:oligopeptide transporter, OPT family [Clostridium botulinum D/C]|uniref:OPT family oligopeptide transporter n=1 Tax=Clostridium botulinum TaxID=1491 RepID=UPI001E43E3B5|nr:oligopeptide transporter, OPT family [Clostridium botulinum D/C]MCD3359749.1 oligopeptide transporter, OPT family [Clostridium botulinum D/C]MCD3361270.1 oligopeptide transporter, OPT family [Clostridium botulinum D/C]MCD3365446.1 oligopeptide transporter, OPT family [Clostridium botulinum D/C]